MDLSPPLNLPLLLPPSLPLTRSLNLTLPSDNIRQDLAQPARNRYRYRYRYRMAQLEP